MIAVSLEKNYYLKLHICNGLHRSTHHEVHLHPRELSIMKPPIKGAKRGPEKTVIENKVRANPLVLLSNMSEKTAATTAKGPAPNIPPQNLHNKTV